MRDVRAMASRARRVMRDARLAGCGAPVVWLHDALVEVMNCPAGQLDHEQALNDLLIQRNRADAVVPPELQEIYRGCMDALLSVLILQDTEVD